MLVIYSPWISAYWFSWKACTTSAPFEVVALMMTVSSLLGMDGIGIMAAAAATAAATKSAVRVAIFMLVVEVSSVTNR